MAVNSVYEVTLRYVNNDATVEMDNVLHYRAEDATIFDTQAEDLYQAVYAEAWPAIAAVISSTILLRQIKVAGVTNPTEFFYSEILDEIGGLTGDVLPYQCAQSLTKRTALRGRRYMGRIQLPPPNEGAQNLSRWESAHFTALQSAGDALLEIGDGVATSHYTLGVYSRLGSTFTPCTSISVSGIVGGQQSRKPGRGI